MSERESLCAETFRDELAAVTDAFSRLVGWMRDPDAMETEAEMAEVADAALFRAKEALDRA